MFTVPDLPYDYNGLEPHVDEQTMKIHHDKHHTAYVNNLNAALEGNDTWLKMPVEEVASKISEVPEKIRTAVRNNGGGHANHSLFWSIMCPGGSKISDAFKKNLTETFGSFEKFTEQFTQAGMTRFGSGWAWLVNDSDKLAIMSTANQDSPLMEGKIPLLGCDVWEHAYYLKYQNMRADYMAAWWNVVNWTEVEKRFNPKG